MHHLYSFNKYDCNYFYIFPFIACIYYLIITMPMDSIQISKNFFAYKHFMVPNGQQVELKMQSMLYINIKIVLIF